MVKEYAFIPIPLQEYKKRQMQETKRKPTAYIFTSKSPVKMRPATNSEFNEIVYIRKIDIKRNKL